ncbi:MAG: hypothetical protein LLF76_03960 [Planctomycetaceae bacterium]|nr:hypothetical protein [Planctomycetaceae bacterium]
MKAKNLIRLTFPAVLLLLLCCVASAGPTYSFVKIAGEWAFYEENAGPNSSLEVAPSNPGLSNKPLLIPADSDLALPAVGSIVNLSSDKGKSSSYLMLLSSGGQEGVNGPRSVLTRASALTDPAAIRSEAYPGPSSYLVSTTMDNGFKNPDLANGSWRGTFEKGEDSKTPNGNAWGYWKKDADQDQDQNIAPVPVPVPGSIILAVVGAGLVKLLHDRRVKMNAAV